VAAAAILVCGLIFSQVTGGMLLITMGVGLTLANNIMSYSFHAYQAELFPTRIRARAVGFVYSWSRLSAIFTSFLIAGLLKQFGTTGVFVFVAVAMLIVMAAIASWGQGRAIWLWSRFRIKFARVGPSQRTSGKIRSCNFKSFA
jgi:putative MFS transporter